MAQVTFAIPNHGQQSYFKSYTSRDGDGTIYNGYTNSSTASRSDSVVISGLPAGATINWAKVYFSVSTGTYGGTHSPASGSSVSASVGGTTTINFTWKSNTGGSYPSAPAQKNTINYSDKTGQLNRSGIYVLVDFTLPGGGYDPPPDAPPASYTDPAVWDVAVDGSLFEELKAPNTPMLLSWSAWRGENNPIYYYNVWYADNANGWSLLVSGLGTTQYAVTSAPAGSMRHFLVQAVGQYSASTQVKSSYIFSGTAVNPPTTVSVSPATRYPGEQTTLSWSGATGGQGTSISGYAIYQSGEYITTVTGTSYTIIAPGPGTYNYTIRSLTTPHSGWNSVLSTAATLTVATPQSTGVLNKSSVNMDGTSTITLDISPASATYTHKVTWYTPSHSVVQNLAAGVVTTTLNPVPVAWCSAYTNAVSGTAYAKLESYNSGVLVSTGMVYPFSVVVPATVVPTVSLSVTPVDGFGTLFIQGKSKALMTPTAAGVQGSTIASYSFAGGGYSGATSPFTTGTLNTSGTNAMQVTVTDSRGRQASASVNITVQAYSNPSISGMTAFRSTAGGIAQQDGTRITAIANLTVAPVAGNSGVAKVRMRQTGSAWTSQTQDTIVHNTAKVMTDTAAQATAYDVEITLTDTIGTVSTWSVVVPMISVMYNFLMDRAGIGRLSAGSKTLSLPDDWTTNINADKLDGQHASEFAAASHNHSATNITSGTLEVARGGTGVTTAAAIGLLSYPVGSIYMSVSSTSPATLFGGTWSALGGRVLIGADGTYAAGATGGTATHGHLLNGYQAHAKVSNVESYSAWGMKGVYNVGSWTYDSTRSTSNLGGGYGSTSGAALGGYSQDASSLPPYLSVYIWKRTA